MEEDGTENNRFLPCELVNFSTCETKRNLGWKFIVGRCQEWIACDNPLPVLTCRRVTWVNSRKMIA
jgi:hypothetical protein